MSTIAPWLMRYGHVLAGGVWVGGYALLAFVIIPVMRRGANETLKSISITAVRVLTYTGMTTIFFGLVLIMYTRGFDALFVSEWGALVVGSVAIAIALLGIGDGALRPALRDIETTGNGQRAQRFAIVGLALTVLAIGLMTRTLYV